MTNWKVTWVGCLLWAAVTSSTYAANCDLPNMRADERPDPPDVATEVTAAFVVADVLGVDDVNQQLDLDLIGTFSWRDPRLDGMRGCRFAVSEVWFPPAMLFNSSNLRFQTTNTRQQIAVGENGQVTYTNRYTGLISSYHNLRRFPFDRHDFEIHFGSIVDDVDSLRFVADEDNTWIARRLNIEGWDVEGVKLTAESRLARHVSREVSVLTLMISASRNPDFYVYRVMVLLGFVVAMSWAIFWVPPSRFEFQIGLGATSMLTAIAFSLSIANSLPRLGYLTILDTILIWAIFTVFLSIVEALAAGLLVLNDRESLARRLDLVSRAAFPALLLGGWLILITWL